jgi:dihydroneopterin aldolase
MKHTIEVNSIKIYAFHGCLPEEGKIGGHYSVDVMLNTNFEIAAQTDDLNKTIDYVIVNQIVCEEMAIRSKLIEHVGQRIINRLKKEISAIELVRLKLTKISPPINGDVDNVAIIIEE